MKDFLLVFRNNPESTPQGSPEEMQASMKKWMDWIGSIAAQNKLVDRGNRLGTDGKVMKAGGMVTDGPYTEIKEVIGGYTIIRANSFEEAADMCNGCPILSVGGNVEIRDIVSM